MDFTQTKNITVLIEVLKKNNLKIMFAESMTAGLLSSEMASIPGASSVLLGSVVCYSPMIKKSVLAVSDELIVKYSCESREVTKAMVYGLLTIVSDKIEELVKTIFVAITGVASEPVNEYEVKVPVGTTFVCLIFEGTVYDFKEVFSGSRNEIRQQASDFVFRKLLDILS